MCDWVYRTYHRKTISRLESTSTLRWTAEEKRMFPALYSIRRMKDLPDIPTAKWTAEEKNARQLQFLNQFYKELENALNALRNDIVHWEREGTANRISMERMKEQKKKAEDFLREGMAARKRGSYPVRVFGVSLTEAELREQLLAYHELRKRSDVQAREHSRLAQAAEEQLVLKRRLLAEKQQQLGVCRLYVERAKNKERIDNMNAVVADIEKGLPGVRVENMAVPLAVGGGDHHKGGGEEDDGHRGLGAQEQGNGQNADEGHVNGTVLPDIQRQAAA